MEKIHQCTETHSDEHHHEHHSSAHKHAHSHGHAHGGNGNIGTAFFLNLGFTVIEIIGGLFTNSVAIVSDAIHDLGDCVSLALAWYFERLSIKGSTPRYTYGYKRFALLGAIINSTVLVVGSVFVLAEAIPRLFAPQETHAGGMFVLAILGIVVNGAAVLRTRKATSINERVVSLHLLEDVLGWAAVLIGAAVMFVTGWSVIDPILSIAIACFVLFNVVRNIREAMPILLQGTPHSIAPTRIVEAIMKTGNIAGVHDLHVWALDENYNVLTAHITLASPMPMDELAALKTQIRTLLHKEDIQHATLEFETNDEKCGLENCANLNTIAASTAN